MPLHHHQDHTGQASPTSQRLTAEEARAVIAVWGQRQEVPDAPTLADVAEALDIETGQARQMLEQVRSQALTRPRHRLRRWAKFFIAAAAIGVLGAGVMCETVAGFVVYGQHIYRPMPVAAWGFGPAHGPGIDVQRCGFISVQGDMDEDHNQVQLFYQLGGDPLP